MSTGPRRRARLVAVGDELLAGAHPDLNSPELAARLAELGIAVDGVEVVSDDEEAIAEAVRAARAKAPLVIVTGGLGPTLDDVTRHGIARALGRELERSEEAVRGVRAWFARRGQDEMPEANLRQALLPRGAALVPNRVGTAPGFRVEDDAGAVFSLPGPPPEMRVVFSEEVVPWLLERGLAERPIAERRFHLFGLSESVFAERAGAWMERDAVPRMGCSVKKGVLSVVLRAGGHDAGAERLLFERARAFHERFRAHVFSEDEPRVEEVLARELLETGTTITLAESCTGGLASGLLTRTSGISAVFARGFVTYSNEAKVSELGVPEDVLARCGAVSPEVARAMAEGAARAAGARLALSITGIAGPGGGTEAKPVGLVWFGTAWDGASEAVERRFPPGDRNWIRALAARHALFLGLRRLRAAAR